MISCVGVWRTWFAASIQPILLRMGSNRLRYELRVARTAAVSGSWSAWDVVMKLVTLSGKACAPENENRPNESKIIIFYPIRKEQTSTASTDENVDQRCRVLKTIHWVRKSEDKTISLSGLWQHCTIAIRNLPSQHSLVPSHGNVQLFVRKLMITSNSVSNLELWRKSDQLHQCLTCKCHWLSISCSICNSLRDPSSNTASWCSWLTVCCWHFIYRTYLWLFSSDASSKCWIFWLFDIMHSQHSHKITHKISFINVSIQPIQGVSRL